MDIIFKVVLLVVGALIGGVFEYIIIRMKGRGQVIRDGVEWSCKLISEGKDVDKFIKVFQEMTRVFLGRLGRH